MSNIFVKISGLFIWLLVYPPFLFGQEVGTYFDYLNVESGLSNNEVTAIVQDKYGFIWIGTRGGLNRYDGYQYVQYKSKISDTNSLVNNSIECLYSDGNYLWIGTKSGGLSRYDQTKEVFTNYQYDPKNEQSLSQNRIVSIFVDSKNRRWFGTFNNGVNLYQETKNVFSRYLEKRKIIQIIEDAQGNIWAVTNKGIFLFNENKNIFEEIPVSQNLIKQATDIALKGNTLFIATWSGNIIQFNIQSKKILQVYTKDLIFGKQQKQVGIYKLFKDKSGRILIGTWGAGVYVLDEEETNFTRINLYPPGQSSSVAFNVVLDFFEDKVGNIWIGTNSSGIVRLIERNAKFQTLNVDNASKQLLKNLHVNSVFNDSRGNLWLATRGKGVFIQKNSEKVLNPFPLPFANKIWQTANDFLEDEQGNIWIGTAHGIYLIDAHFQLIEHLNSQMDSSSLSGNQITSFFKDSKGITWIGTQQNGLNKLLDIVDGQYIFKRYEVIPEQDGFLNNERITSFSEAPSGKIWIGTYGGLHLFDTTKDWFTCFKVETAQENGISSNIITSLDIDKQNNLWIGTPNGLNHLNLTSDRYDFTTTFADDGFQNDYINAIESDQFGQIWVSTNQGISNYNPTTLDFRNYDLSDGLSSLSYSENGSYVGRNGLIYFGGAKGISSFYPQQIEDNKIIPNVYLTSLSINDQKVRVGQAINGRVVLEESIKETKDLLLNYKDRIVSFQFTALNYIAAQNNRYKYQLEGYDENWIVANSSRSATYGLSRTNGTNIPHNKMLELSV